MRRRKHKTIFIGIMLICCLFLLSGCSFTDLLAASTGVNNDPDYQTWEKLEENNKLDADGHYTADAVHITFGKNAYLNIKYYLDEGHKQEINTASCFMMPGEMIYAAIIEEGNPNSDRYEFDHFEIAEYDENNTRIRTLDWSRAGNPLVLIIPVEYRGTEVSVEPYGTYKKRKFSFSDYAYNEENDKIVNIGTWKVNGEAVKTSAPYESNPLDTYGIEYRFDCNKYFYRFSEPECLNYDNDLGLVVFKQASPATGEKAYKVALGLYVEATVELKKGGKIVSIDHTSAEKETDTKWKIRKLRPDDSIIIISEKEIKDPSKNILCSLDFTEIQSLGEVKTKDDKTCYEYRILLGDKNRFAFNPAEYPTEHGKLKFKREDGALITDPCILTQGTKIICEAEETEEGYWLPNEGLTIEVIGSRTAELIRKVQFYPYHQVTVLLDQPPAGGKIEYTVQGEKTEGKTAQLFCGTRITAKAIPDPGWDILVEETSEYIVRDQNNQSVTLQGKVPSQVFTEPDTHKPTLKVELKGTVGRTTIRISSGGEIIDDGRHPDGEKQSDSLYTLISDEKVGTGQPIDISMITPDNVKGNAYKITIHKETDIGGYHQIHYVGMENLTDQVLFNKNRVYKTVSIIIEGVTAEPYQEITSEHAEIDLRLKEEAIDISEETDKLLPGDLVEDNTRIIAKIIPDYPYYMTGDNTKDDQYSRELSYSEVKKIIPEALNKQLKKFCLIELDETDQYGTVKYKLNGLPKSGTILAKAGQTITIEYEITNNDYDLETSPNIFKAAVNLIEGKAGKKIEYSVTVSDDMDGKTIHRYDYIEIKKR